MAEFLGFLLAGNVILAISIIVAVWAVCIVFDCFAADEENGPEDRDHD